MALTAEYYPEVIAASTDGTTVFTVDGREASIVTLAVAYNELRDAAARGALAFDDLRKAGDSEPSEH